MPTNSGPGHNQHPSIAPVMPDLSATAPHKLKLVCPTPQGGKVLHGKHPNLGSRLTCLRTTLKLAVTHARLTPLMSYHPVCCLIYCHYILRRSPPSLLNQCVSLGTLLNATAKGHRSTQSMSAHPTIAGVFPAIVNLPSTLAMSTLTLPSLSLTPLCQVHLWILKHIETGKADSTQNFD